MRSDEWAGDRDDVGVAEEAGHHEVARDGDQAFLEDRRLR
jgi:hypothetical protein